MYAVAKCFAPEKVYSGFNNAYYTTGDQQPRVRNTKLLVTIFNGGKVVNSAVKFTKFYLVIDACSQGGDDTRVDPIKIIGYYQKFLVALKKSIQATKAGEAGFKLGVDGAYFNATANIAESFKMIEDAIIVSGANDDSRKVF